MWLSLLWAPWRFKYILQVSKNSSECFLCEAIKNGVSSQTLVVYESKHSFIILNRYPYNSGHLMVAPIRHVSQLEELNHDELVDLIETSIIAKKALDISYKPDGFNIGLNIGKAGGAGLETHIHLHIVPRWVGDTNFMTTVSETKVLPELLEDSYKRISDAIKILTASH
ncbi:MAG: HIT family protein [Thermoprotei archaeon]|jgi:ATP adenylyltransferase